MGKASRKRRQGAQTTLRVVKYPPIKVQSHIGETANVPGVFWHTKGSCQANTEVEYSCTITAYDALHNWPHGHPSQAVQLIESGPLDNPGRATNEKFWMKYPLPFLEYYYAANPLDEQEEAAGGEDDGGHSDGANENDNNDHGDDEDTAQKRSNKKMKTISDEVNTEKPLYKYLKFERAVEVTTGKMKGEIKRCLA